jgi:iron complex outermembrane receptor protein
MEDARTDSPATAGVISAAPTRNETQKANNIDQYVQGLWSVADRWDVHAGVRHTRLRQSVTDHLPATNGNGTGSLSFDKTVPVIGTVFMQMLVRDLKLRRWSRFLIATQPVTVLT